MRPVDYIAVGIAVISVTYVATLYRELWKWSRQCRHAQIVVAYNNKVQLRATLAEWLGWANQLGDEKETGRIIYVRNKVRVAVLRPGTTPRAKVSIRRARKERKGQT